MPFGSDTPDSLRLALGGQAPGGHPPPEELVAFRDGELAGPEVERLREHLSACEDCATEMLELEVLHDGESSPEDSFSHAQVDAAWRRRRLKREPATPRWRPRAGSWSRVALRLASVAALLFAVLSVVLWRRVVELGRPRANPPIVQLLPAGALRAAMPEEVVRVDLGDEPRLVLVLNSRSDLDLPAYAIEAFDSGGRSLFRLEGVAPSKTGSFSLEVPRDALPFGRSRVVISRPDERRPLETFEVERVGPVR